MPKINKWVADLTLRLGPITVNGYLSGVRMSATKAKKPTFKSVSPAGKPVKQVYQDDDGNVFQKGDLGKAAVVKNDDNDEETLVPVDVKAIEEAKESALPNNVVNLTVHPSAQVDRELYHAETNGYVFTPHTDDPTNVAWYRLLAHLSSNPNNAFVSVAQIRNNEGLYRVFNWNDRIVLQRVLYPHEVNTYEEFDCGPVQVDSATLAKGENMLAKLMQPFDAEDYRNSVTERLIDVEQGFINGDLEIMAEVPVEEVQVDLSAALDAFGEL